MKPKQIKDARAAWLQWFMVWLTGGVVLGQYLGGEDMAWAFLGACWASFVTWAGVTAFIFGLILLAVLLGSPLTPWKWLQRKSKND